MQWYYKELNIKYNYLTKKFILMVKSNGSHWIKSGFWIAWKYNRRLLPLILLTGAIYTFFRWVKNYTLWKWWIPPYRYEKCSMPPLIADFGPSFIVFNLGCQMSESKTRKDVMERARALGDNWPGPYLHTQGPKLVPAIVPGQGLRGLISRLGPRPVHF